MPKTPEQKEIYDLKNDIEINELELLKNAGKETFQTIILINKKIQSCLEQNEVKPNQITFLTTSLSNLINSIRDTKK